MKYIFSRSFLMFVFALVLGITSGYLVKLYEPKQFLREVLASKEVSQQESKTALVNSLPMPNGISMVTETDSNNTKTAEGQSLDGVRLGTWRQFHGNGTVASIGEYKNNTRVGEWKFYYPNNQLLSSGQFDSNGQKTGTWNLYYENGNPKAIGNYLADLRVGNWKSFPYEGSSSHFWTGSYNDIGEKHGDWIWKSNNVVGRVETYRQGQFLGAVLYNGNVKQPNFR